MPIVIPPNGRRMIVTALADGTVKIYTQAEWDEEFGEFRIDPDPSPEEMRRREEANRNSRFATYGSDADEWDGVIPDGWSPDRMFDDDEAIYARERRRRQRDLPFALNGDGGDFEDTPPGFAING